MLIPGQYQGFLTPARAVQLLSEIDFRSRSIRGTASSSSTPSSDSAKPPSKNFITPARAAQIIRGIDFSLPSDIGTNNSSVAASIAPSAAHPITSSGLSSASAKPPNGTRNTGNKLKSSMVYPLPLMRASSLSGYIFSSGVFMYSA